MSDVPRYPDVVVPIWHKDTIPLVAMGIVSEAMRKGGVSYGERHEFAVAALASDTSYESLLTECSKWVRIKS